MQTHREAEEDAKGNARAQGRLVAVCSAYPINEGVAAILKLRFKFVIRRHGANCRMSDWLDMGLK